MDNAMGVTYENATLKEIVEQLELCDFQCEGGSLVWNAAFIELKHRARHWKAPTLMRVSNERLAQMKRMSSAEISAEDITNDDEFVDMLDDLQDARRALIRMREVCQSILDVHEKRGAALTAACGDTDIVCRAREALTDADTND